MGAMIDRSGARRSSGWLIGSAEHSHRGSTNSRDRLRGDAWWTRDPARRYHRTEPLARRGLQHVGRRRRGPFLRAAAHRWPSTSLVRVPRGLDPRWRRLRSLWETFFGGGDPALG